MPVNHVLIPFLQARSTYTHYRVAGVPAQHGTLLLHNDYIKANPYFSSLCTVSSVSSYTMITLNLDPITTGLTKGVQVTNKGLWALFEPTI